MDCDETMPFIIRPVPPEVRIGREPKGLATTQRNCVAEQHSADSLAHEGWAHLNLIEIRFKVNEAKRGKSNWLLLEINRDVS